MLIKKVNNTHRNYFQPNVFDSLYGFLHIMCFANHVYKKDTVAGHSIISMEKFICL